MFATALLSALVQIDKTLNRSARTCAALLLPASCRQSAGRVLVHLKVKVHIWWAKRKSAGAF